MPPSSGLRVLVVNDWLRQRIDESGDVYELVAGLLASDPSLRVLILDRGVLLKPSLGNGELTFAVKGGLGEVLRTGCDVAHFFLPIPPSHLLRALLLRLRGCYVVLSPMAMLGDDFARRSWFRRPSRPFAVAKPSLVKLLRSLWRLTAQGFVAVSEEEITQAHLPRERTAILPYPFPPSPLLQAAREEAVTVASGANDGPVAFVSRLDVHRKGVDRLCRWLATHEAKLPRPAVRLFAPGDTTALSADLAAELDRLVAAGIMDWDQETRGPALLPALRKCRGLMLLSRFDGQPRVLREAAFLGVPIAATRASGFAEIARFTGGGVVVEDGDDPKEIHRAFHSLAAITHDPQRHRPTLSREPLGAHWAMLLRTVATGGPPNRDYSPLNH